MNISLSDISRTVEVILGYFVELAVNTDGEKKRQLAAILEVKALDFEPLFSQWSEGNLGILSAISILPFDRLSGAHGAYSIATDTIYIADRQRSFEGLVNVLLEEINHAIALFAVSPRQYFNRYICPIQSSVIGYSEN